MKKTQLIKILESIDGDPDVVIWNGFVNDWMDIKSVEEIELHRMSDEKRLYFINLQRKEWNQSPISLEDLKSFDEYELEKEDFDDESKKSILIQSEIRAKTSFGFDSKSDLKY